MAQRRMTSQQAPGRARTVFLAGLALLFVVIAGGVGLIFYQQVRELVIGSEILPELSPGGLSGEGSYIPGLPLPEWQGTERVNILVLGIDERSDEDGPWRTDTMLVLTIDPLTKSAGMLSIPRDLWVPIPGYEEGRINTANYLGDADAYPGGGPALAMHTVQWNLGVHIHHYVRINFRGFVELVDRVGGIDIYVEEEIRDPTYPGPNYDYDPLYIPAGWVSMDGELALKYARTRHSSGGDFDRARRQQQVLTAILDKVIRLEMLPELAFNAGEWQEIVGESVQTDLALDQILALANLATKINRDTIRMAVIDENYTQFWTTPDGAQVLVPVRDQMRELRDYVFTTDPERENGEDRATRLAEEAAAVEVENGTSTAGLARSTYDFLVQNGIQATSYTNADRLDYTESMIIVYTGKNYTAETIAELLALPPTAIVPMGNPQASVDIIVILGTDYRPQTP